MFILAFKSALQEYPQTWQRKVDWLGRFFLDTKPHTEHIRDVLRGSTNTTFTPASWALYAILVLRSKKLQLACRLLWGFLTVTLSRIPWRFSRAIPRPSAFALSTSCLEITWLTSLANRLSLRLRFFKRRLADLVPFFCSFFLIRKYRFLVLFNLFPAYWVPVLSEVILIMPRSTPRNSLVSSSGGSGTSTQATK